MKTGPLAAALIGLLSACGPTQSEMVRPPAVAGAFYPGESEVLRGMVRSFLDRAEPRESAPPVVALIAPHAGYVYSGQTAAWAYRQIDPGAFDTVILLGLAHRYPLGEEAALSGADAFRTPLGDVPIDRALEDDLLSAHPAFVSLPAAHRAEHSIEVHLPFLQEQLNAFSIVPILTGNPPPAHCRQLGEALAEVLQKASGEKRILMLASADLTHYPPDRLARPIDRQALEYMADLNPEGLYAYCRETEKQRVSNLSCVTCSEGAVMTALYAARRLGAVRGKILHASTSADSPYGQPDRVVGYGAVALYAGAETPSETPPLDGDALLSLARRAVEHAVRNREVCPAEPGDDNGPDTSVFVTLEKNGRLRGCIGSIRPTLPLRAAIKYFAHAAALTDYRFPPVPPGELDDIVVEVSVLSPLKKAESYRDVIPGAHGVIIERNGRTGVFLPQVWEHFPSRDAFLSELASQKAHLPREAWKDPETTLYLFTVTAFKETHE